MQGKSCSIRLCERAREKEKVPWNGEEAKSWYVFPLREISIVNSRCVRERMFIITSFADHIICLQYLPAELLDLSSAIISTWLIYPLLD